MWHHIHVYQCISYISQRKSMYQMLFPIITMHTWSYLRHFDPGCNQSCRIRCACQTWGSSILGRTYVAAWLCLTYSDADAFSEEGSAFRCISLSFHCVLSELLRLQAPRPQVEEELPAVMRAEEQLTRLDREVVGICWWMTPSKVMDPCVYIICFREIGRGLDLWKLMADSSLLAACFCEGGWYVEVQPEEVWLPKPCCLLVAVGWAKDWFRILWEQRGAWALSSQGGAPESSKLLALMFLGGFWVWGWVKTSKPMLSIDFPSWRWRSICQWFWCHQRFWG